MSQRTPNDKEADIYAECFVLYGDKTRAFRKTFPSSQAKPETIHQQAVLFFKHQKVRERIKELSEEIRVKAKERFDLDSDWLLGRLKEVDELDVLDIFQDDLKSLKPLSEWPKAWRTSISGIDLMTLSNGDEPVDTIVKKIKWPDKTKNLELIGRHVKVKAWEKDAPVVNNNNIMPVPTAASAEDWEEQAKAQQEQALNNDS